MTVTVNGVADDGRPGEGDDVRDLDVLQLYVPATVIGTDGAESVEIYAAADREPSSISGRGGSDDLRSGSGRETIDGGAGDGRIEGGFNHDTLTGGPGRDVIYGDSTSGNCGGYGQSCTLPFGNDTIDARDGEADQVDCGPGQDTAKVDAVDTVAANCESVDRAGGGGGVGGGGAGGGGGSGQGGGGGGQGANGASLVIAKPAKLRRVLRDGLVVKLAGFKPGVAKVRVHVKRKLVAAGVTRVGAGGRATVRVRFARKARRSLSRRRSVKLVVRAGSVSRTITVKR